jgi:FMN phosphatase YigB (HAD superfamily)
MLLIFDLDDTLIPTSNEITPKCLEAALKKMIENGLSVNFEEGKKILFEMNSGPTRTSEVIKEFVKKMQGSDNHVIVGMSALEESLLTIGVQKTHGLNNFLRVLKEKFHLAIVTGGNAPTQQAKIDLYGIDKELFVDIIVEEWGMKERSYLILKERFGPFIVVGDRIKNDLSGAKKLGGTTIHVRQGRGVFEPKNHPDVDFEIASLKELTEVLERV